MARAPDPPLVCIISSITSTSVFAKFTDGPSNGGAAIDSRRIAYGTSPSRSQLYISSDGSTLITGLLPGTRYYFWAQTHNAVGYSGTGPSTSALTLDVPARPKNPVITTISQVSVLAKVTANETGGAPITQRQISYGLFGVGPYTTVEVPESGKVTIDGLQPKTNYGFRARVKNSVGWSIWTVYVKRETLAGAYVKVGNTYRLSVPYVKVAGVWKVARPWARLVGVWKETV